MPIQVSCPSCNRQFNAPDDAAGKKAKCPSCRGVIEIPGAGPVAAEIVDAEDAPQLSFSDEDYDVEPPAMIESSGGSRKPCPMCGEMIASDAVKCRFCGEVFDPVLKKQALKAQKSANGDADLSVLEWIVAILCGGIGCILGIVYIVQGKPKGTKMLLVSICASVVWSVINVLLQALMKQ